MENRSAETNVGWDDADKPISGQFDWTETPPSVAVARLISVAMNCDPTAVDPLGQTVDPDALDRLLVSMDAGAEVEFTHFGLSVDLDGDGRASVRPLGR